MTLPTDEKQGERISFPRWWIQQARDQLFDIKKLPSGYVGDWVFLFREQLNDALSKPRPLLQEEGREDRPEGATHVRRPEYITAWLFDRKSTMPIWLIKRFQSRPLPDDRIGHYATAIDGEFWRWFDPARFDEMFRALPPSGQVRGWRPIETAPKDGTRILLFQRGRGAFEGWWHAEHYWMDDQDSEPNPTHWQPLLPEPPLLSSPGSGG